MFVVIGVNQRAVATVAVPLHVAVPLPNVAEVGALV
jgi:hypothetical protein